MNPGIDAAALTAPVQQSDVKAWAKQSGYRFQAFGSSPAAIVLASIVAGLIVLSSIAILIPLTMSAFAGVQAGRTPAWSGLLIPLVPFLIIVAIVVVLIVSWRAGRTRAYRLSRFAAANGLHYVTRQEDPPLPGMIFTQGHSRYALDILRGSNPRFVEFGDYRFTTGSGKNRTVHKWNYIAVHTDALLPHIVLDATKNNSLFGSNLPVTPGKSQRLSLEGDFDTHFTLYCPTGYERDALYLFTPDVMARFIDTGGALDVEIVDDWLFFYDRGTGSSDDPATWAWRFSVVHTVMEKIGQWQRWRDDRILPNATSLPFTAPQGLIAPPRGVAPQGRRLKMGRNVAVFIGVGLVVLWNLLQLLWR